MVLRKYRVHHHRRTDSDVVEADFFKVRGDVVTFFRYTFSYLEYEPVAVFYQVDRVVADV